MKQYEEITEEPIKFGGDDEIQESHPAFAMIRASRVTGTKFLYGSDFQHHHFVTVTISRGTRRRGLSNDWYHGREELIEVSMSEAQWASFISSMNVGSGVPCTLEHVNRIDVPVIPCVRDMREKFIREDSASAIKTKAMLAEALAEIEDSKMSAKAKAALKQKLTSVGHRISGDLTFAQEQFGEYMERTECLRAANSHERHSNSGRCTSNAATDRRGVVCSKTCQSRSSTRLNSVAPVETTPS